MAQNIVDIPNVDCVDARRITAVCSTNECGYTETQYAFIKRHHEICQRVSEDVIYGFKIFIIFSICLIALVGITGVYHVWMESRRWQ